MTLANEFLHEHVAKHPLTCSDCQRHQIELVADLVQPIVAFMVLCSITICGFSIPTGFDESSEVG